jgi:hypothetical protein
MNTLINLHVSEILNIHTWWNSIASKRFISARNRSTPHPSIHRGRPVLANYLVDPKRHQDLDGKFPENSFVGVFGERTS